MKQIMLKKRCEGPCPWNE